MKPFILKGFVVYDKNSNKPIQMLYEYVRKGKIPYYKAGRKLYFYEDELLNWIGSYKKKTHGELMEEIHNEMTKRSRFKRH
jgi:hypothetical protein